MTRFSVIVPMRSTEAFADACLASVQGQTGADLEVIAVDDDSPDGCGAIIDRYARADHHPRGGSPPVGNSALTTVANVAFPVCWTARIGSGMRVSCSSNGWSPPYGGRSPPGTCARRRKAERRVGAVARSPLVGADHSTDGQLGRCFVDAGDAPAGEVEQTDDQQHRVVGRLGRSGRTTSSSSMKSTPS